MASAWYLGHVDGSEIPLSPHWDGAETLKKTGDLPYQLVIARFLPYLDMARIYPINTHHIRCILWG